MPISLADVREAERRIRPFLRPTLLSNYALLDETVGNGIRVLVKHENHNPTGSFKVRNGLSAITALPADARLRGVVAGSRGNHGQGVAYAGRRLGVPVVVCVPRDNNPEKNAAMRALGAELVIGGNDYDEAVALAEALATTRQLSLIHSTNNRDVLAGAGTIALEIAEEVARLDAIVVAIGGGSQAVGAITVLRALCPQAKVYGVQAAGASTLHDAWHAGKPLTTGIASTFADGIATREVYPLTFDALRNGLAGFVTVSDAEIAEALRTLLRTTHNLAEGAGAAGLAGLVRLRHELTGQMVAIVLSGGNIDEATLRLVLERRL